MKKIITTTLLIGVLLFNESFTGNMPNTIVKGNKVGFNLNIDAAPFDAKAENSYSAQLLNDGKTASITFMGNEGRDAAGNILPNKIQLNYVVKDGALGEVSINNVSYEYNGQKYNGLPGTAFMSVTKMKWNDDHKSFVMSADLFCKVQKTYIMEEFVPVFVIRGNVQNVTVNVAAS